MGPREKRRQQAGARRVSFEEAAPIFSLPQDRVFDIFDQDHSDEELRWKVIGPALPGLLLVVYTERIRDREDEEDIRIISARHATKAEIDTYHQHLAGSQSI